MRVMLRWFPLYCLFCLVVIFCGFINGQSSEANKQIGQLHLNDALWIFIINSFQIIIWFALSPIGISVLFTVVFLYGMGQAPYGIEANPVTYYMSSFSHGILEIFVSYIVLVFTFQQFRCFYQYLKYKDMRILKKLYLNLILRYIPASLILMFIASFLEVYLSNRIFLAFID
ncbi:stage II sporulation protein M [Paenibacillus bouchesdurhonensis]|uniref:stage II sporulation protein M n=1 Tax=Paenibacillus bouchesdurhonensis TaxID=1870990 RepID=UPI000DA63D90|nr:stage II sporulation protein M [Paenibacillus bouchesdurhonensis]